MNEPIQNDPLSKIYILTRNRSWKQHPTYHPSTAIGCLAWIPCQFPISRNCGRVPSCRVRWVPPSVVPYSPGLTSVARLASDTILFPLAIEGMLRGKTGRMSKACDAALVMRRSYSQPVSEFGVPPSVKPGQGC